MENATQNTSTIFNVFERLNQWIQESIMIKLISIGFLILILLIPSAWIEDLIVERQNRSNEVITEISGKWSGRQTIAGPVLVIPYLHQETVIKGNETITTLEKTEHAFFLPENLTINGKVEPEVLNRGIFEAVVYSVNLDAQASFSKPDFKSLNIPEENIQWTDAHLIFSISDFGGINSNPKFQAGTKELNSEPSPDVGVFIKDYFNNVQASQSHASINSDKEFTRNGIVARLNWKSAEDFTGPASVKLNLKGSESLTFVPAGKETSVNLAGPWSDPSFDGEFIPDTREVTENGFTAQWNVLHFNRPFKQQWTGDGEYLTGSEFGVRLLVPVDQYQKSMRTSKYAQLIIILTFMALFLVEIVKKIRIHPFQYILVGAALTIYYTLLLSISEHLGYDTAYWIATMATVTLVSLYATTFLRKASLVILLTLLMTTFYSFIYVIILQQDLSLLIGSIGLFVVVAALMFFSRKVTWYKEGIH